MGLLLKKEAMMITIHEVKTIEDPSLISYLASYRISLTTARAFLKEAHCTINDTPMIALAFAHDDKQWTLFHPDGVWHTKEGMKTITSGKRTGNAIAVFQCALDFLCAASLKLIPDCKIALILNTPSAIEAVTDKINKLNPSFVYLFLENTAWGKLEAAKHEERVGSDVCKNWACTYSGFVSLHTWAKTVDV